MAWRLHFYPHGRSSPPHDEDSHNRSQTPHQYFAVFAKSAHESQNQQKGKKQQQPILSRKFVNKSPPRFCNTMCAEEGRRVMRRKIQRTAGGKFPPESQNEETKKWV